MREDRIIIVPPPEEEERLLPLPRQDELYASHKPKNPKEKSSKSAYTKLIVLTSLIVVIQFILGLFGELLPEGIKEYLTEFATDIGLSYGQFWAICVFILIILLIAVTVPLVINVKSSYLKKPDDIEKYLKVQALVEIPRCQNSIVSGRNKYFDYLSFIRDSRSGTSERFRELRTSIVNPINRIPPRTILVTSPMHSEGKTNIAINLALALGATGDEVVLIDCDLRRPRLHAIFNLHNSGALSEFLSGSKQNDHLIRTYPDMPSVKIITSGPVPPNPAELLGSESFVHLLKFLKKNYRYIIIDSPPAIAFADASVLAAKVDGVVLVAKSKSTNIKAVQFVIEKFKGLGAEILGVVLNGTKPSRNDTTFTVVASYYTTIDFDDYE